MHTVCSPHLQSSFAPLPAPVIDSALSIHICPGRCWILSITRLTLMRSLDAQADRPWRSSLSRRRGHLRGGRSRRIVQSHVHIFDLALALTLPAVPIPLRVPAVLLSIPLSLLLPVPIRITVGSALVSMPTGRSPIILAPTTLPRLSRVGAMRAGGRGCRFVHISRVRGRPRMSWFSRLPRSN